MASWCRAVVLCKASRIWSSTCGTGALDRCVCNQCCYLVDGFRTSKNRERRGAPHIFHMYNLWDTQVVDRLSKEDDLELAFVSASHRQEYHLKYWLMAGRKEVRICSPLRQGWQHQHPLHRSPGRIQMMLLRYLAQMTTDSLRKLHDRPEGKCLVEGQMVVNNERLKMKRQIHGQK